MPRSLFSTPAVFRSFCCGFFLGWSCFIPAQQQAIMPSEPQSTVVLFTPGGHWRGMGEKLNPFAAKAATVSSGSVFDGDALMATLTHSRYVVLRVKPGIHTLSASRMGGHANPKQAVKTDMKPGVVYYFAITTTVPSAVAGIGPLETSHIQGITCDDLQVELQKDRLDPLDTKRVGYDYESSADNDFDLSTCRH